MIHTKELRFGNKLQTRQGQVITVQQILSNSVIYDSKLELNSEPVSVGGSLTSDFYTQLNEVVKEADCNDLQPIALTPDILQTCGFRNFVRDHWLVKIAGSNYDWEFSGGKLRLMNPSPCLTSIQYLHQLQNFLFAIANYELEFISRPSIAL